jgi:hypothetical protein
MASSGQTYDVPCSPAAFFTASKSAVGQKEQQQAGGVKCFLSVSMQS